MKKLLALVLCVCLLLAASSHFRYPAQTRGWNFDKKDK